ncbi:ABC transporter substrate-binding protein [Rhodopila sp.]|uniref:ABC transporter substrate-binding protein n=1 Tax=Rhodopila sp. TaxID=2480087 RepID=UPI003D0B4010
MKQTSAVSRRLVLVGSASILASPAIIGRAAAALRGVSDSEIVIGTMADLSGVTAVQGVNNANGMRLGFDEANQRGGVHGRKIRWIVEDNEYIVPKAVQAMNKLLNRDNIFFAIGNGGTPHNDAVMPSMFEKNVPNVFPTTCARSMYEPFNRLKFGQFASYYDQMRAGVKYFVEQRGKKVIGSMYQDTDFGRDVHAGVVAQLKAMGLKLAAETAHRPTDTDFNAALARQHDAGCDLICAGTIVKDTTIILQTAHKMGWNVEFCGQFASYSTAVAEAPGEPAEGFYSMAPALYRYPDDPKPAVHAFAETYRKRFGIDPNYLGEAGYTAAGFSVAALEKAGRNLTLDSFIGALESMRDWQDIFGGPALSLSPTNHHASSQSFLSVVKNRRWTPVMEQPLMF